MSVFDRSDFFPLLFLLYIIFSIFKMLLIEKELYHFILSFSSLQLIFSVLYHCKTSVVDQKI